MSELIYQTSPIVTLATNKFINVPIILKFEETNLIEIIKEENIGFTTQIPIYHSDGTYLAKVVGNRIRPTDDGKKAGIKIDQLANVWECKLDGKTLFEIHQGSGDSFKALAELYTPEGCFVKYSEKPSPHLIDTSGETLNISGITMSGNTFNGNKIGIWIRKSGQIKIGVNG